MKNKYIHALILLTLIFGSQKLEADWGNDFYDSEADMNRGSYCDLFSNGEIGRSFEIALSRYQTRNAANGLREGCSYGINLMPSSAAGIRATEPVTYISHSASSLIFNARPSNYHEGYIGPVIRQCDSNTRRCVGSVDGAGNCPAGQSQRYEAQYCENDPTTHIPDPSMTVLDVSDYTGTDSCPIKVQDNAYVTFRDFTIAVKEGTDISKVFCDMNGVELTRNVYLSVPKDTQYPTNRPHVNRPKTVNTKAQIYDVSIVISTRNMGMGSGGGGGSRLSCDVSSSLAKGSGYNLRVSSSGTIERVTARVGRNRQTSIPHVICETPQDCRRVWVNPLQETCYGVRCSQNGEVVTAAPVCVNPLNPGSGGMSGSGGMNPGTGGMSGSGGMNPGTGGMSGSGGMNPGTGGMSGSGGMNPGTGGMSGSGGGTTDMRPSGSFTFEAGMGNAVTIRWRAVNGMAKLSGGGLDGSRVLNPMSETTGTVNDIPVRPTRYTLTVHPALGPDFTVSDIYTPPAIADPAIDFTYSLDSSTTGFLLRWTIQNSNTRTLAGPGIASPVVIEAIESSGRAVAQEGLYTITATGILNTKSLSRYVSRTTGGGDVGPAPECTLNRVDTATGADFTWNTAHATSVSFGKVGVVPAEDTSANRTQILSKRTPLSGMDIYLLSVEGSQGQSCKIYSILMPRRLIASPAMPDPDGDGICDIKLPTPSTTCHYFGPNDAIDNCPGEPYPNPTQANADGDFLGDACDPQPNAIDFPNQFGSADGGCSCNLSAASTAGFQESLPWVGLVVSTLILFFFRKMRQQSQVL